MGPVGEREGEAKNYAEGEEGRPKWAGLGKELFTSADNYIISLNEEHSPENAALLLAAGLAVDTVYKEK